MFKRNTCFIVCRCNQEKPIQLAAVEYYCTKCCDNCFYFDNGAKCLRDPSHPMIVSARCLNKIDRCSRMTGRGECVVLRDARQAREGEECPMCFEASLQFLIEFNPCSHTMCIECFRRGMPNQARYLKNKDNNWVPACPCCAGAAQPGSCSLAAFKLLAQEQYNAVKDRGLCLYLAEEQASAIVCDGCNALNDAPPQSKVFNCRSCGNLLCAICKKARRGCRHDETEQNVLANLKVFVRRRLLVSCPNPQCNQTFPIDCSGDDMTNSADCLSCRTSFCIACGRTQGNGPLEPKCTRHRTDISMRTSLDSVCQKIGLQNWAHVFFLIRAFVLVSTYISFLSEKQKEILFRPKAGKCPLVACVLEITGCKTAVETLCKLEEMGWDIVGARPREELAPECVAASVALENAARMHFPEWFSDFATTVETVEERRRKK